MSLNKAALIGRIGKDPEIRSLENGAKVANFSLATDESWKDKTTGEKKQVTTWHNIVLWRGLAEIAAKFLHKGDLVYIEGKITQRSWEKEGQKHYITEIVGNELQMLGSKGDRSSSTPAENSNSPADNGGQFSSSDPESDLPF